MSQPPTLKLELFYFGACIYCLIVRIAIWLLRLKIPRREVMFDSRNRTALELGGGKFQVPCLRIESEEGTVQWMYESIQIIRYLKSLRQGATRRP